VLIGQLMGYDGECLRLFLQEAALGLLMLADMVKVVGVV
jgi:hypothetical protein